MTLLDQFAEACSSFQRLWMVPSAYRLFMHPRRVLIQHVKADAAWPSKPRGCHCQHSLWLPKFGIRARRRNRAARTPPCVYKPREPGLRCAGPCSQPPCAISAVASAGPREVGRCRVCCPSISNEDADSAHLLESYAMFHLSSNSDLGNHLSCSDRHAAAAGAGSERYRLVRSGHCSLCRSTSCPCWLAFAPHAVKVQL